MPQGRRKIAFSGKAKKLQMQVKKQRNNPCLLVGHHSRSDSDIDRDENYVETIQKINKGSKDGNSKMGRYALEFFKETKEEIIQRKKEAMKSIEPILLEDQEISTDFFPTGLDMPKRPEWNFNMSKEQLEIKEQRYFAEYLKSLESLKNISYFELNLETWRQLWRVIEISDVLLIIVDIRYPVMMFPPYLYNYVVNDLEKNMILILNKVDLAPPALVVAWKEYFIQHYPKLHVLMFTSFPVYNLRSNEIDKEGLKKRRRRGKLRMAAEGAKIILNTCQEIVDDKVDLSSWHEKIQAEMHSEYDWEEVDIKDKIVVEKEDTSYIKHEKYKNGVLTIGCVGTPNVGKSSLMNALMGQTVVSVSKTPGHTKHFQTIFLTKTVCLCDCPGLVFPSVVPKQFQILMGSFPIAQVREPYTTIRFLGERINLPKLLKLVHQENDDTWSAMDICDSWAAKRHYFTAKAARLDSYRAANAILRMALEGQICIYVYPPGWSKNKEILANHPDVEIVKWIQARNQVSEDNQVCEEDNYSSSEEEFTHTKAKKDFSQKQDNDDSNEESEDDDNGEEISSLSNKFEILSPDV